MQRYMVKLPHGLDVFQLAKISPDFKLKRKGNVNYVDVYFGKMSYGPMSTYEDGRIIFNYSSETCARKRASVYLSWLIKNGFIIFGGKLEVISL